MLLSRLDPVVLFKVLHHFSSSSDPDVNLGRIRACIADLDVAIALAAWLTATTKCCLRPRSSLFRCQRFHAVSLAFTALVHSSVHHLASQGLVVMLLSGMNSCIQRSIEVYKFWQECSGLAVMISVHLVCRRHARTRFQSAAL